MNLKGQKDYAIRIIFGILAIACMVMIFLFSADNGEESSSKSGFIVRIIEKILGKNSTPELTDKISFAVRKLAHFSIYAALGFFISGTFQLRKFFEKSMWVVLIICFFYACTDEIHQLFVPDRSGQFRDVMIDTCGSFFGTLIFLGIIYFKKKLSSKQKSAKNSGTH